MLAVDLHCHSHFSHCGLHSVIELLTRARELGMKALAVTDHGGAVLGRIPSPFYDRLVDPVPGIRLLKGMECNVLDKEGEIDLPTKFVKYMDVVLLGLHPNLPAGLGIDRCTSLMLKAIESNPAVDIITHPNDVNYPVDFARLTECCARLGVAIEFNNSKSMLKRADDDLTVALVRACKTARCTVAVNSDAHAINEIGEDSAIRAIMKAEGFPEELVVNRDADAAFAWLAQRRARR